MQEISRKEYAAMYGPTTGDRVRLADTSLIVEVEKDYCVYGDEAKFGGWQIAPGWYGTGRSFFR